MIRRIPLVILSLLMVSGVGADTVTFNDGKVSTLRLTGFSNRKFDFKGADGTAVSEYPLKVKSIVPDSPLTVSLQLSRKQYDSVTLVQFDHNTLRLKKDGQTADESVIMLKSMSVVETGPAEALATAVGPAPVMPVGRGGGADVPQVRDWKPSGKWAEIQDDKTPVISRGEVVKVEASLKPGYINIVHFHMPQAVASIREGNYVQSLAAKRSNRIVVLKVIVPRFDAPVCKALNLDSLPQFWFYDSRGKLVKKLTNRFTEGDIDAAVRDARSF